MGCDIHTYLEIYSTATGKWHSHSNALTRQLYIYDKELINDFNKKYETKYFTYDNLDDFYSQRWNNIFYLDNRNYSVFSVLADVRSGYSDGLSEFIQEPKGIPPDCSEITSLEIERWGRDMHSHSYMTFAELLSLREDIKSSGDIYEEVSCFFDKIQKIKDVLGIEDLEHVRLVFGFDN